jgi:hypothetical protein
VSFMLQPPLQGDKDNAFCRFVQGLTPLAIDNHPFGVKTT